mmetsp:Transcript_44040/g.116457  ORF Transcript_44040/g.116457 Transcript_44040/m.116457 type:complete len:220 (+) Transcript_44040:84-743(+)
MAFSRLSIACAAAALCGLSVQSLTCFLAPAGASTLPARPAAGSRLGSQAQEEAGADAGSRGLAVCGLAVGIHAGLALALCGRGRTAMKAAPSASEDRLFEKVYMDYTTEYLKGPMYWHEDKLQGFLPDYPGAPMFQNGKMTSNVTGNLKTFSSNELAYFSLLFLAIGLYGNAQFLFFDPQWAKVDAGQNFNVSYIVESLFLPISFFMHIACYVQKKNGK